MSSNFLGDKTIPSYQVRTRDVKASRQDGFEARILASGSITAPNYWQK